MEELTNINWFLQGERSICKEQGQAGRKEGKNEKNCTASIWDSISQVDYDFDQRMMELREEEEKQKEYRKNLKRKRKPEPEPEEMV